MESFSHFKLGNDKRILFWHELWLINSPLKDCFPRLFAISPFPDGAVLDFWDVSTLSWNIIFRRLLKEEKIDFQSLLGHLSLVKVVSLGDSKVWSLEPSGFFSQ